MELTLVRDPISGGVVASTNMEHQAVANWLNTEYQENSVLREALRDFLEHKVAQKESEFQYIGKALSIYIADGEVQFRGNDAPDHGPEGEDMDIYEGETSAECGLEDFIDLLKQYQSFR